MSTPASKANAYTAAQGGFRGKAPKRYLREPQFLDAVKELFWANQEKEAEQYEDLLYALEPPADAKHIERMQTFRGYGPAPGLADPESVRKLQGILRKVRYPDVKPLRDVVDVPGLTMPRLTTVLHFHHPAYPIYSRELVQALVSLGIPAVYREQLDEEALEDYRGVMAILDRLKEHITFENVPESNCFLTRVLEGALREWTARSL